MKKKTLLWITGELIFLAVITMLVSWIGLMGAFEYPDILRKSAAEVLSKYYNGGIHLRLLWLGMTMSSVIFIPVILLLHKLLNNVKTPYLFIGTAFGLSGAIFSILGFVRWVFSVNVLANLYHNSPMDSKAIEISFQLINAYGGVSVGELLGYMTTGIWIIFIGYSILKSKIFHSLSGIACIICGIGVFSGILGLFDISTGFDFNAWSYMLYFLLLLYLGGRVIYLALKTGSSELL